MARDFADVDLDGRRTRVTGNEPGPLFTSFDPARKGNGRLTGDAVARIVAKAGQAVGVPGVRPHSPRNSALTGILDRSGGDVHRARVWSRHAMLQTVALYGRFGSERGAGRVAGVL